MGTMRRGMIASMVSILAASFATAQHGAHELKYSPAPNMDMPRPKITTSYKAFNPTRRTFGRAKKVNRLHLAKKAKLQRRRAA